MIKNVIIERIEDYVDRKRYEVWYMKNGYGQKAIFMEWGDKYKLIESEHYSRNGLSKAEKQELSNMIKKLK